MAEWIMIHPWMTFCLLALALLVVESAISNICKAAGRRKGETLPELPKEADHD